MKILAGFEKLRSTWFLVLIIFLFFLLRLPSLVEPNWYQDEGIYDLIGMALNNHKLLYGQIWDNKPPLLYLIYAFANADQFNVRLISLLFGTASLIPYYLLSSYLFRSYKIKIIIVTVYALLFAVPLFEGNIANAENFIMLPVIIAAAIIFKITGVHKKIHPGMLFIAGLLLGIAFLLKIVVLFDFTAFLIFILTTMFPDELTKFYKTSKVLIFYILGFLAPLLISIIYFAFNGTLGDYINAAFFGVIGYVGYTNKFIAPLGFLFIKLLILSMGVLLIYRKRKHIPHYITFILLWFMFSLFNALFSGRIWTHYLLVLLPSAVLVTGLLIDNIDHKFKRIALFLIAFLIIIMIAYFKMDLNKIKKSILYYQNFIFFITNRKSLDDYQAFFDQQVPRDYEIAQFIRNKTKPRDNIFVWGNNPQIYVLAHKLPPGKYTVEYHINQSAKSIAETADDIRRADPKYVIILPQTRKFPYALPDYGNIINLGGANIYERYN